jgi:polyhydroxybutyrate depolymerase
MMRFPLAGIGACLALALVGCGAERFTPPPSPGVGLEPGTYEISIQHAGATRAYLLDVPPAANRREPLPVVLAFHGGGGNAAQFRGSNGLVTVAAREGFLLVHPQGTGLLGFRTWNAGFCCGRAANLGADDVGFVEALLDDLATRTPVDSLRIHATGHSNGGMITYRLAAEIPLRLASIAPVGGARLAEGVAPRSPVPLLHIHSTTDPRAYYEGGLGPPFPGTNHRADHPSVESVLAEWRQVNGCSEAMEVVERREVPAGQAAEAHLAERLAWEGCPAHAPLEHWRLTGPGHGWPGDTTTALREEIIGPPTEVISAAEEVWRFFQRHARRH